MALDIYGVYKNSNRKSYSSGTSPEFSAQQLYSSPRARSIMLLLPGCISVKWAASLASHETGRWSVAERTKHFSQRSGSRSLHAWSGATGLRGADGFRTGPKYLLIGSWEWELRRVGDRELTRPSPANLFPGRGR